MRKLRSLRWGAAGAGNATCAAAGHRIVVRVGLLSWTAQGWKAAPW